MKRHEISDEQLAAYLENILSTDEAADLERKMDADTLEVLGVSRRALQDTGLPAWDIADDEYPDTSVRHYAMAGFLGDENEDDMNEEDPATDGNEDIR